MIAQRNRFHGHASLKYLMANGRLYRGRELSIKFVDNKRRKNSRIAIIVGKKVIRHAVDRNRARRRLYEIMRQRLPSFNRTIDVAIIVYQSRVLNMSSDELASEVDKCLRGLGVMSSQDTSVSDRI